MSTEKNKDIVLQTEQRFNDFSSFVNSLEDRYSDPRRQCKLCNSPSRDEANVMFEKGRPALQIHRWLIEEKKEDISYGAVNNHLNNHLRAERDALNLKEFSTQLAKWSELNTDTEVLLNRYIKMFDREATLLLSKNNEQLDVGEVRKNIETAIRVAGLIGTYKAQLQTLQAEKRPVELVITSLNRIIQIKLEGSNNPDVKRALQDIVEQLSKEIGDYAVDGENTVEN